MSIKIYTGAASEYKQQKVLDECHRSIQLNKNLSRGVVFLFPQVSIAKEFSHRNAEDMTFMDSAYSFNRWVEKIWEQHGSSRAIVDAQKREKLLFSCSSAYNIVSKKNSDDSNDYLLFPGVQSVLSNIISRFGNQVCDKRVLAFLETKMGKGSLEIIKLYFEELNKNHLIEHVDAMYYIARKELELNTTIVVDGFNDFSKAQLFLLESLSINNDICISLNFVENNFLCLPLKHYISYFQNKKSAEISIIESNDTKRDVLDAWKANFCANGTSCHEEALNKNAIGLSLAVGRHAELVAIGEAVLKALRVFEAHDIAIAIKNSYQISGELSRYLEGQGVHLAYDLVAPLKSTVFGGALIDLLCMDEKVCAEILPSRDFQFQPVAKANAIFCSPIVSTYVDKYYVSDRTLRQRFRDYKQACSTANRLYKEYSEIKYSVFDEYLYALRTKSSKDFKKLFDVCLANFLSRTDITLQEQREASLIHHAILEELSKSSIDSKEQAGIDDSVDVEELARKIYHLKLKFTKPQGSHEVLLTDAQRVRGRKIPCLILAGLDNDSFNIDSQNFLVDELEDFISLIDPAQKGYTNVLTVGETTNLLMNELIAAAQKKIIFIGQCADSGGEQKALIPFVETMVNNLDNREISPSVDRGSNEDMRDRLKYLKTKGVGFFDSLTADVFGAQVSVGGDIKTPLNEPSYDIYEPERGVAQLPLFEKENIPFEKHEFSPSALEAYAHCPYRWFANSYLPASSFDKGLTPIETGNFIHKLLQDFYEAWIKQHGTDRITSENISEAESLFDTVLDSIKKETVADFSQSHNPFAREFCAQAKSSAWSRIEADTKILGDALSDTVFSPAKFELRLGKGRVGDTDTKDNLQAFVGDVKIAGSIDRVDENERGDYFVIDYKGSVGNYGKGNNWIKDCTLQAALYWLALENATGHSVAGAAYSSYSGKNEFNYLFDPDLISEELVKTNPKARPIETGPQSVLNEVAQIASESAHLMFEGNVQIARDASLNGRALDEKHKGCSYCLFKACPGRVKKEGEEGDK